METLRQQAVLFPPSEPKISILWGGVRVTAPLTQALDDLLIPRRGQNTPGVRKSPQKSREGEQCRIKAQVRPLDPKKWAEDNHRGPRAGSEGCQAAPGQSAQVRGPEIRCTTGFWGQQRKSQSWHHRHVAMVYLPLRVLHTVLLLVFSVPAIFSAGKAPPRCLLCSSHLVATFG